MTDPHWSPVAEPPPDRSPVTFRCVGCGHTRQRPYEAYDGQTCPDCGQPSYAWEHNGIRWNTLMWGDS